MMKNIKVTVTADTPAMEWEILGILRRENWITIFTDSAAALGKDGPGDLDAVLLAWENPKLPEGRCSLVHSIVKRGIPVICIVGGRDGCRQLKGLPGCSVIQYTRQQGRNKELFEKELLVKIKSCYGSGVQRIKGRERRPSRCLVGLGASTGGPKALLSVLSGLSEDTCGILMVQHMSRGFTENFAQYLNPKCRMQVKTASAGEVVCDGTVYLAPENRHLTVAGREGEYVLHLQTNRDGYDFFPSIDRLFESIADCVGRRAMGIILTGMGADGADGILKMRQMGAYTVGQNQETSDIYSMPYEARRRGGIVKELPLEQMAGELEMFSRRMQAKDK